MNDAALTPTRSPARVYGIYPQKGTIAVGSGPIHAGTSAKRSTRSKPPRRHQAQQVLVAGDLAILDATRRNANSRSASR